MSVICGLFLTAGAVHASDKSDEITSKIRQAKLSEEQKLRLLQQQQQQKHKALLTSLPERVSDIPSLIKTAQIKSSEIPDPHWQQDGCIACHTKTQGQAAKSNLRSAADAEKFCQNCHSTEIKHSYVHPVGIEPSNKRMAQMQPAMKKIIKSNNGKIGCLTCHDMTLQCRLENRQKHENPKVLRGGPFIQRYKLCGECHSEDSYQRLNPHQQFNKTGEVLTEKCRICHSGSIDDLLEARSIDDVSFHASKNTEAMCWGCHQWKPHPGGQFSFFKNKKGPNHLVKPSANILANMEEVLEERGLLMPLEPGSGRVFCATCHNPHAKGIIKNPAAAYGADADKKLRAKPLCVICHAK
ncbi:MAG: hypothetical protein OEY36_06880 [Gammaproteobacteria bacterium]|nr:hypothetical protein [Gammaproteobacteria bacterium]